MAVAEGDAVADVYVGGAGEEVECDESRESWGRPWAAENDIAPQVSSRNFEG